MTIAQRPVDELAKELESRRKGVELLRNDDEKKAAQHSTTRAGAKQNCVTT